MNLCNSIQYVKPLYVAGTIYFEMLMIELGKCEYVLNKWKYDSKYKDREYKVVNLDLKQIISVICQNGETKVYTLDTLHYGPRTKNGKYTDRDTEAWARMGTLSPFRSAQFYMLQRGYYLVELSDPSKSFKTIIRLYKSQSPYPEKQLWHNHNNIHGVITHTLPVASDCTSAMSDNSLAVHTNDESEVFEDISSAEPETCLEKN